MDCDIYIEIKHAAPWLVQVCRPREIVEVNSAWWQSLMPLAGPGWASILALSDNQKTPLIKRCQRERSGKVRMTLWGGSESYPFIESLLPILLCSGCLGVEAWIYTDECEYVADEYVEGVYHRLGTRFYFSGNMLFDEDCLELDG